MRNIESRKIVERLSLAPIVLCLVAYLTLLMQIESELIVNLAIVTQVLVSLISFILREWRYGLIWLGVAILWFFAFVAVR